MDYFITVVGLLVFSENSFMPYSFYVKWDDVQSYETYHIKPGTEDNGIIFILKDGSKTVLELDNEAVFLKLIESLNSKMMTEVMLNDKQTKVEVNCEKR